MPANRGRPELRRPLGPGNRVRHADQVYHDLGTVEAAATDRVGDRVVVRGTEHRDQVGPRFRGDLDLERPGVHDLHVGDDAMAGNGLLELPDRVQPFALDQRSSGFNPVRSALDRLARRNERPREVLEVERDLKDRPLEPHTFI